MKRYSHDALHKLIDGNARLKERSNKIHALRQTDSLEEWAERKREMMKIYAVATRCERVSGVLEFVDEVMGYIKNNSSGLAEWRRIISLPQHSRAIQIIAVRYLNNRICFSPSGNNYVCFCAEMRRDLLAEATGGKHHWDDPGMDQRESGWEEFPIGTRVEVRTDKGWVKGTVVETWKENDKGISVKCDEKCHDGNFLDGYGIAVMVYMNTRRGILSRIRLLKD